MFSVVRISVFLFLSGVATGLLFRPDVFFVAFLSFFAAMFGVLKKNFRTVFFFGALFFAFGAFLSQNVPSREDSILKDREGEKAVVAGIIAKEPDVRENSMRLTVRMENTDEKVLVVTKKFPEFAYGDRVEMEGKIERPENFTSDTGREFDYISYLQKDRIFYEMPFPKITVLSRGEGSALLAGLFAVKNVFLDGISRILPEPHSGLMGGVLFGEKRALGKDLSEDFRIAGIVHIIVLSGYNITIIADFLMRFFSFLPRIAGMGMGAFGIVLFALMTGAGASTIRASIMALLVIFARATGRTEDSLHFLFIAAFAMVALNPMILLYDPSFQLSFLATLGLFLLQPELLRRLSHVTSKWGMRETLSATLATQIFVLPLLLYQTGIFSIVALPVNLLILPTIPAAMFFGFFTGLCALVSETLALVFGMLSYLLLSFVLLVVRIAVGMPFAAINLPVFPVWIAIAAYFFLAAAIFLSRRSLPRCS